MSVPMTLSDPGFKVTVYLARSRISQKLSYGQSYYRTLIGNHPNLSNGTTFNDLDRPSNEILRSQYFSILNISETTRDRAIVTVERQ